MSRKSCRWTSEQVAALDELHTQKQDPKHKKQAKQDMFSLTGVQPVSDEHYSSIEALSLLPRVETPQRSEHYMQIARFRE
eukprot:5694751-Amphidinium_carterae.1